MKQGEGKSANRWLDVGGYQFAFNHDLKLHWNLIISTLDASLPKSPLSERDKSLIQQAKDAQARSAAVAKSTTARANAGDPQALFELGVAYANGTDVPQDYVRAFGWFRRAAEKGHVKACNLVGKYLRTGTGVHMNDEEALKWFRKAAEQGDSAGQVNVGLAYFSGIGTEKNRAEATKWFQKAAMQGAVEGQFWTGYMHEEGDLDARDYVEAFKWYTLAETGGEGTCDRRQCREAAAYRKNILKKKMTQEQVDAAKQTGSSDPNLAPKESQVP